MTAATFDAFKPGGGYGGKPGVSRRRRIVEKTRQILKRAWETKNNVTTPTPPGIPKPPGLGTAGGVAGDLGLHLLFPPPAEAPTLDNPNIPPELLHPPGNPPDITVPGPPPFTGGQDAVGYYLIVRFSTRAHHNGYWTGQIRENEVRFGYGYQERTQVIPGPIRAIDLTYKKYPHTDQPPFIGSGPPEVTGTITLGGSQITGRARGYGDNNYAVWDYHGYSLVRADNEPDTGGDPPGTKEPYSPPPPQRPPITYNIDNRTQNNYYTPSPALGGSPSPAPGAAPAPAPEGGTAPGGSPAPGSAPAPAGNDWGYPQPAPPPLWTRDGAPPEGAQDTKKPGPLTDFQKRTWYGAGPFPGTGPSTTTEPGTGAGPGTSTDTELKNRLFPPPLIFPPPPGLDVKDGSKPGPEATEKPKTGPITQSPPSSCRNPGSCSGKILDGQDALRRNQNDLLDKLNAGLQIPELGLLKIIDNKLGPQLPNGGISSFMRRAWKGLHMDKALNALNTMLLLHNAAMLSRDLGETLGDLTSSALDLIGIKDEDGNMLDVNALITDKVKNLALQVLGEDVYNGVARTWHVASRVTSAAANIAWSLESIADAGRSIAEFGAETTAKIGNALRRDGVIREGSLPEFPEIVTARTARQKKIDRIIERVDSLDDAASALYMVTSDVREIGEEVNEIKEIRREFDEAIAEGPPRVREPNKVIKKQDDETKRLAQMGPDPSDSDLEEAADE